MTLSGSPSSPPKRDRKEYSRQWKKANPDKVSAANKRSYQTHRADRCARSQRYRQDNRPKTLAQAKVRAERRHGVGEGGKMAMLAAQGGCCLCCGSLDPFHTNGWQLHHIHGGNGRRVILCSRCNYGSARFRDDPTRLRKMAEINEMLT